MQSSSLNFGICISIPVSFHRCRMFVTYIDLSWKLYSDLSRGVIKLHVKPCINFFARNEKDRWCLFAVFYQIPLRFHAILSTNAVVLWWDFLTLVSQTCRLFFSFEEEKSSRIENFIFLFVGNKQWLISSEEK